MKAGVDMKAETDRVRALLMDTVVLLCKNGLRFEKQLKVEGVIGITIDADVFLVHINEQFSDSNEPVALKQENSDDVNDDKSVAIFGQSASKTRHIQQRTTTFQPGDEFIDCDEEESFGDAVKEETVDYDDDDGNRRDDGGYGRYGRSETSLSTRESTAQRSAAHWSFLNQMSNNGDGEGDDVTDDGMFMSTYADTSSASYSQQQQQSLSHLDDQMRHSMDNNLLQWSDASQFSTSVRPTNNRPIANRCHPNVRKRRTIPRGRGRASRASWFPECRPQPLGRQEWPTSSEYTMPSVQARARPTGRGGLRAKVETQASDGFSYGKLTTTKYVCNICEASYKHQCNLLTHQVRVHGRQKKKTGRRPKNADPDDDLGAM